MYILLLILGVLLIVLGISNVVSAAKPPRIGHSLVWGIILIVLGVILLPTGWYLR